MVNEDVSPKIFYVVVSCDLPFLNNASLPVFLEIVFLLSAAS